MVKFKNECPLSLENISSENGILIRSQTGGRSYKYYYIEDCNIARNDGSNVSNFSLFTLLPRCPITRSLAYQSIRLSALSSEMLASITSTDKESLLEHEALIATQATLPWGDLCFFGIESAQASGSQFPEANADIQAGASQAREARMPSIVNQEGFLFLINSITNPRIRENYNTVSYTFLIDYLSNKESLPLSNKINNNIFSHFFGKKFPSNQIAPELYSCPIITNKNFFRNDMNHINTKFFAPNSSDKTIFLTHFLKPTFQNPVPLKITPEIEELFNEFNQGRMTVEELLNRVQIAERESAASSHSSQRP